MLDSNDKGRITQAAQQFFTMNDNIPTATPGTRPHQLQEMVSVVLCMQGATRMTGRAPAGGLSRAIKGKGKGQPEEDWMKDI